MILTVTRDVFRPSYCMSMWHVDGVFECFGVEDADRKLEDQPEAKVHGKSAIPRGEYALIVTYSPRFKRDLPLLVGVKGFTGVRIHPGNSAIDTEGCLPPGTARDIEAGTVSKSRPAFNALFKKINAAINRGEDVKVKVL